MNELEKIEQLFYSSDSESRNLSIILLSDYCNKINLDPKKYYYGTQRLDKHFANFREFNLRFIIIEIINALKGKDYKQFYYKVNYNPNNECNNSIR